MSARVRLHRMEFETVTLHFSPGYRQRAHELALLVAPAHAFLSEWLGVEARTIVSVLRRESWRHLRRPPYGYPHSTPEHGTIYAPANYPSSLMLRARGMYEAAPEALKRVVVDDTIDMNQQVTRFYDLVAVHELGHLFIHHLGLALGTRWLTELVANLFATAYFTEERPDLARLWNGWADIQAHQNVPERSLEAYESDYAILDFANAAWYQGHLNQRARELWSAQGRSLVAPLIEHFSVRPDIVAARFKRVAPDFTWREDVEP